MPLPSYNFKRKEFSCHCGCGYDTVDAELLNVISELRAYFEKPVSITSGHRCEKHNSSCGGSKGSQHLYGKAADISVSGFTPAEVFRYLDQRYPETYGIGLYRSWVHIDVRPQKARW